MSIIFLQAVIANLNILTQWYILALFITSMCCSEFPYSILDPVADDFMLVTDFLNNEILQIPLTDPTKVIAIP